jgi:hypothetical protein
MEVRGSFRNSFDALRWIDLVWEQVQLMLTRASARLVAGQQAVRFLYLYSANLPALREHLSASE